LKKAALCGFLLFHAQTGALSPQPDGIGRFLAAHWAKQVHGLPLTTERIPGGHSAQSAIV
jgi:hypothetical protein